MEPDSKLISESKMNVTRRKMPRTRLFSAWCYLREKERSIFHLKVENMRSERKAPSSKRFWMLRDW